MYSTRYGSIKMIQLDFERKKMMTQAQANQPSQTHLKKMTKKKIEEEKEILRALGGVVKQNNR